MQELFKVFRDFADLTPARRGTELMGLFEHIEKRSEGFMRPAFESLLEVLELPSEHNLAEAGKVIAELIDSQSTEENYGGHGNSYHNRNHMFEVPTAMAALLKIHENGGYEPKLDEEDKLVLLISALSHDLGHNGKGNGMGKDRVPLLTENRAIELAKPVIRAFYTDDAECERVFAKVEVIIAATDIGGGDKSPAKFFADYAKYQRGELNTAPVPPLHSLEKFVPLLESDPKLAHMCLLMQDADLLPSIGLTPEWAERQEARLSHEFPSGPHTDEHHAYKSALWFYDNLADLKSAAGKEFLANFETIKAHALNQYLDTAPVNEFKMSGG